MALVTSEQKIDTARRYRCWQSHFGPAGAVARGEVFPGDDPCVVANPQLFVDHENVTERDMPGELDGLFATLDAEQAAAERERRERELEQAKQNKIKIEPPHLLRLNRDVVARRNGRIALILKGSVVVDSDQLVLEHPDDFVDA